MTHLLLNLIGAVFGAGLILSILVSLLFVTVVCASYLYEDEEYEE